MVSNYSLRGAPTNDLRGIVNFGGDASPSHAAMSLQYGKGVGPDMSLQRTPFRRRGFPALAVSLRSNRYYKEIQHDKGRPQSHDDGCRDPGFQRRTLAYRRARWTHSAAGSLPHRADGQLQPGADSGAPAPREGLRGLRALRSDQGCQRLHQGRSVPAGYEDGHVDPVLHGGGRTRQP